MGGHGFTTTMDLARNSMSRPLVKTVPARGLVQVVMTVRLVFV